MKKIGIALLTLVVVFGLSTGVMASYSVNEANLEDGGEAQADVDVGITVEGYAVVQVEDAALNLDIDDPTEEGQKSNRVGIDVHSNTAVRAEFKSLGMDLPEGLASFIDDNPEVDDFHPAEYFEYNAIESKGGPHEHYFYPDVSESDLDYITEVDVGFSFARWWYGSNAFELELKYTHHEDLGSQDFMQVDEDWLGWEPLMAGDYEDTIQITVSAQ